MTETITETITEVKTSTSAAIVEPLEPTTHETCDGCGIGTSAVFAIMLASSKELSLCRHHAIRGGFATHDTVTWLHAAEGANRKQGDAHA